MPARVAALPQDRRGFPVPWVSCWSSCGKLVPAELELQEGPYTLLVTAATCDHVAGEGTPQLAGLCVGNQIRGMIDRLCDVCGERIEGEAHFIGQMANEWFRECACHTECAVYSLQVCPGISTGAGVGVQSCQDYRLTPRFLHPEGEREYDSFVISATLMNAARLPGVLVGVHGRPIDPTVRTRTQFLEEYL